jgi:hypothetical protein
VAAGVTLDVYPARDAPDYRRLAAATPGLRVHETLRPADLMRELPAYDFGWAGFNAGLNAAHLDTALPNKAFEYLAAGLPVLTFGHRALSRFLEREAWASGSTTSRGSALGCGRSTCPRCAAAWPRRDTT